MSIRLLPCLVLFVGLAACQSGGTSDQTEGARSDGFPAPSRDAVWEVAVNVMREQGFTPDFDASARSTGKVASRWRNALSPFSREGYREMATVRVIEVEGRPNFFRTETNVTRQNNTNIDDPSNVFKADWGDGTRNQVAEGVINSRIEMYFLPGEVSDVFRRQHGMPERTSPRLDDLDPVPPPAPEPLVPGMPPIPNPFDGG